MGDLTCTNNNNNNNNFGTGSRDGKKSFKLELCFCYWEREMLLWVRRGWEGVAKGKASCGVNEKWQW